VEDSGTDPVDDAIALSKLLSDQIAISKQLVTIQGWDDKQLAGALQQLIAGTVGPVQGTALDPIVKDTYPTLVYLMGIFGWIAIWEIIAGIQLFATANLGLFGSGGHWFIFLLPPQTVALTTLFWNAYVSWKHAKQAKYQTELGVIELVEKNAGLFLVGSSAIFVFASFAIRDLRLPVSFSGFIIYETLSLIFLSFVLLLHWIPDPDKPLDLARLRHFKSVPFTYAVSFFLAALMTVTTAALPGIGV